MRNVEVVQQMIDWIEDNMEEEPTLQKVSNRRKNFGYCD